MSRPLLIRAEESCLIVIDMQERLVPAMQAPARTIRNAKILITAARRLAIPVLLTEQYPKGLGRTVPDLAKVADGLRVVEKLHFSCIKKALLPPFAPSADARRSSPAWRRISASCRPPPR